MDGLRRKATAAFRLTLGSASAKPGCQDRPTSVCSRRTRLPGPTATRTTTLAQRLASNRTGMTNRTTATRRSATLVRRRQVRATVLPYAWLALRLLRFLPLWTPRLTGTILLGLSARRRGMASKPLGTASERNCLNLLPSPGTGPANGAAPPGDIGARMLLLMMVRPWGSTSLATPPR